VSESRYGVYSEPRHREAAAFLGGVGTVTKPSRSLSEARKPRAPVLVLYLVRDKGSITPEVGVGFGIQYPGIRKDKAITWTLRDKSKATAVIV